MQMTLIKGPFLVYLFVMIKWDIFLTVTEDGSDDSSDHNQQSNNYI